MPSVTLKTITTKAFCLLLLATYTSCDNNIHKHQKPSRSQDHHHLPLVMRNGKKPNIVLFLTDDQDVELGSLNFMPKTLRSIRDHGAEFRHAYVTTPMCCPSRSSILTGMYVHNHQVYTNNDNCSSTQWQATHEKRSFATYLSNAGYRTGYFGKYLNKYNGTYIPPGWREWGGLIMNSKYYNYSINMNGKKIKHGFEYDKDYYTDLIANDSITFLRNSKKQFPNKPLMLTMAFPAPHGPEDSAPQYSSLFFNISTHHTPSYDHAPNPDKQWILQVTKKMEPVHRQFTDLLMTKRLQTLQSVDTAVEQVVNELKQLGELDNTYIIYTSDHGYHLGQFGLIKGKSFPFEFDVRVPFLIRGPGITPGSTLNEIVLNIDLAPTFLDMAGVEPPVHMDGHSIMPLFLTPKKKKKIKWPDTFLIESSGRRETPYLDNKQQQSSLLQYSLPLEQIAPKFNVSNMYKAGQINEFSNGSNNTENFENGTNSINSSKIDDFNGEIDMNITTSTTESNEGDIRIKNSVDLPQKAGKCLFDTKLLCRNGLKRNCHINKNKLAKRRCQQNLNHVVPTNREDKKCFCFTSNGLVYRTSSELNKSHDNTSQSTETNEVAKILPECTISKGRVNCSNALYQDKRTWQKSRYQIEGEIFSLKQKLENLKEIKKHLKFTKPRTNDYKTDSYNTNIKRTLSNKPYKESPITGHKRTPNSQKENGQENNVFDQQEASKNHNHRHHHDLPSTEGNSSDNKERVNRFDNYKRSLSQQDSNSTHFPSKKHKYRENCYCEDDDEYNMNKTEETMAQQTREDKRRLRKQKRKEEECHIERMTCFEHNNDHWRTEPKWEAGPFCFCMNANNNTYSCLRTINNTHNFLYCEFTTGLITFYNLRIDPFELRNRFSQLKPSEKSYLKDLLKKMVACKGNHNCTEQLDSSNIRF
ncbi:extracellular sulfatase SULF-1 homolog isoform X2 [Sitophilus oryzae]|uniref:Extracellular sulfatase SULF-1 homolog isoform X2 n=1 Tax=Sitophilus oryzae TaxID=7048 RepID=A0A6J2XB19_SITOR|nr:extracellular sulfatase SULF-1 homolog isoform X2 [Sitophilus oryzae]